MVSSNDSSSSITRRYDSEGRLLKETQSSLPHGEISYGYDNQGRKNRVTLSNNSAMVLDQSLTYDSRGDLISVSARVGKQLIQYSRTIDALHRPTKEVLPNGITVNYTYDSLSRVTQIKNLTDAGINVSEFDYNYSPSGNITQLSESSEAPNFKMANRDTSYSYDASNRVVSASGINQESFSYDAVGNFTNGGQSHDSANKLLSDSKYNYTYDLNGNMTAKTRIDNSKQSLFTWDAENKLTGVTLKEAGITVKAIAYKYDGLNRRIEKVVTDSITPANSYTRRFIYDGNNIVAETDGTGKLTAFYVHTDQLDHPVAMVRDLDHNGTYSANEVFTYTRDHLGSIRDLTDSSESVIQRYRYSVYGITSLEKTESSTDHEYVENFFAYTGREYDLDTELFGYRNRYYLPEIGRFISEDPIELQGGVNLYQYTKNNPLKFTDSLGLAPGDLYGTPAAAGAQAIKDINGLSVQNNIEYAGWVYQNTNGTYSYTAPLAGGASTSNPGAAPIGAASIGIYHTHSSYDSELGIGNNIFSEADLNVLKAGGFRGYLGTPLNSVLEYDPFTKSTSFLSSSGGSCK